MLSLKFLSLTNKYASFLYFQNWFLKFANSTGKFHVLWRGKNGEGLEGRSKRGGLLWIMIIFHFHIVGHGHQDHNDDDDERDDDDVC